MWIENRITRGRFKKSENEAYISFNTDKGNPAIRISEKAKNDLGWEHGDYVNIFIDSNKIFIVKDNEATVSGFTVHHQSNNGKYYGFNIYGQALKDALLQKKWKQKESLPITIKEDEDLGRILVVNKTEAYIQTSDKVLNELKKAK